MRLIDGLIVWGYLSGNRFIGRAWHFGMSAKRAGHASINNYKCYKKNWICYIEPMKNLYDKKKYHFVFRITGRVIAVNLE